MSWLWWEGVSLFCFGLWPPLFDLLCAGVALDWTDTAMGVEQMHEETAFKRHLMSKKSKSSVNEILSEGKDRCFGANICMLNWSWQMLTPSMHCYCGGGRGYGDSKPVLGPAPNPTDPRATSSLPYTSCCSYRTSPAFYTFTPSNISGTCYYTRYS